VATVLFLTVLFFAASTGAITYSPGDLWSICTAARHDATARAFLELRVPRLCDATVVGAALALSGALLQGLLRNPLVDPYLTGSSAGATCAIALAITFGLEASWLPFIAFAASLSTAVLALVLSRMGRGISVNRMILAGVSLSALFAAVVTLVLTLAPSTSAQLSILAWLGGSLAGRGWPEFRFASLYIAIGAGGALLLAPTLNALRLGEGRAQSLGVHPGRAQWNIVIAASLLTAGAVTLSGMVGFVGLIVPHLARRFVGSDARWFLPLAGLLGASVLLAADALARSIAAPTELPLGILLALIGVPIFLLIAYRNGSALE
jgi:iron complex transport system permease protein